MVIRGVLDYKNYLRILPVLLLSIGCGIDSGTLMTISFVLYLITCQIFHEQILSAVVKDKIFFFSCLSLFFWLLCLLIPMYWTGGNYNQLLKFAGRALPMVLLCLMARKQKSFYFTIWLGFIISLGYYEIDTILHPIFSDDHRLMGTLGYNTLSEIVFLLCPFIIMGIIQYHYNHKKLILLALLLVCGGLGIILLTGSRNAYLVVTVTVILLVIFLFKTKNKFFLKWGGGMLAFGIILGVILSPPQMISQRLQRNISDDGRVWLLQVGWDIYQKNPNTGIGIGNWGKVYHQNYELPGREKNIKSPHNIYLQTLDESGRIGLIGLLAMFTFQFAILLKDSLVDKALGKNQIRWTFASFLLLMSILISGLLDYGFFDRHTMHLFWFYWGIAICDIYYHRLEVKDIDEGELK